MAWRNASAEQMGREMGERPLETIAVRCVACGHRWDEMADLAAHGVGDCAECDDFLTIEIINDKEAS